MARKTFLLLLFALHSAPVLADSLNGAWTVMSGCNSSSYPGREMSFSAAKQNGLMTSNAKCQRTPSRFIKVNVGMTTGGTAYSETFFGIHTGEFLILPPIQNTEYQPLFSVSSACPASNRAVNWLYVQWNDGAVALNNNYLLGTADIQTNGNITLRTQYDINGSLYWGGSHLMTGTSCSGGVNDITGSGNLGGRVYWTANDGGVFKTNPGKATFFLPSETIDPERLGGKTFEGITFDSSTSTFGLYSDAIGDIRYITATTSEDGKSIVLRPLSDPETGALDAGPLSFQDTITFSSVNFPKPGMLLGQVSRSGSAALCSSPPCTGNLACIARTTGSSGMRILCSGQSPIDNTIPYHFTLFRPYDCPAGYVRVPRDTGASVLDDICVAKYEMKNVGGVAVSQAAGTPWTNIDRPGAIAACRAVGPGYDLITNAEWQATARNIEDAYAEGKYLNWSNGSKFNANALQTGHSDNDPGTVLSAGADDDPCYGTGNSQCSDRKSADFFQRRTFQLSTGAVIWDFAGNVSEWVRTPNWSTQGSDGFVSLETFNSGTKSRWGAKGNYTAGGPYPKTTAPYGNLGYGTFFGAAGGTHRGGALSFGNQTGIYYTFLGPTETSTSPGVGFRCVYHSLPTSDSAALFFAPANLSFGSGYVGVPSDSGDIYIFNEGNGPATFASPQFTAAANFSVTSTTCPAPGGQLPSGAGCTIRARFLPTAPGTITGAISVNWTTPGLAGTQQSSLGVIGTANITQPQGTIFVTSVAYAVGTGVNQFMGILGADARCQERADAAGIGGPRRWRALLSDSTQNARDRITYDITFKNLAGQTLSANKAGLLDGTLDRPLTLNESGQDLGKVSVWSGSAADLTNGGGATHCTNWTSTSGNGWAGQTSSTNQSWIRYDFGACTTPKRLYCFDSNY